MGWLAGEEVFFSNSVAQLGVAAAVSMLCASLTLLLLVSLFVVQVNSS